MRQALRLQSNPFPTDKRVKFPWAQLCHLLITPIILGKPGSYDNHLLKHAHCGVTKCHSSGLRVVESGDNYTGFILLCRTLLPSLTEQKCKEKVETSVLEPHCTELRIYVPNC